jgi:hypothetical protein
MVPYKLEAKRGGAFDELGRQVATRVLSLLHEPGLSLSVNIASPFFAKGTCHPPGPTFQPASGASEEAK